MIVVSLLLILVAVALLVLGLGAGSSALLISSIVASLLAAVALVIGARRAASLRVTTTVFTDEPRPAEYARTGARRRSAFPSPPSSASGHFSGPEPSAEAPKSGTFAEAPPSAGEASSDLSDASPVAPFPGAGRPDPSAAPQRDSDLDPPPPNPASSTPLASGGSAAAGSSTSAPAAGADGPVESVERGDGRSGVSGAAMPGVVASDAGEFGAGDFGPEDFGSEEFGSGDDADPADEPLPQAIRPADAVRIARLTTDVFVVDGRPRYHLAECSHLSGRRAEAIPADEAMELGFTPCSLCRPVDHLVAESTRR